MGKMTRAFIACAIMMCILPAAWATTVASNNSDGYVKSGGGYASHGDTARLGMGNAEEWNIVFVFELPVLPDGEDVLTSDLEFSVIGGSDWHALYNKGTDLYAIRMSSSSSLASTDYFNGDYDTDATATAIQEYIFFEDEDVNQGNPPDSIMGRHSCDEGSRDRLTAWLNSCYDDPSYDPAGTNYVFLRLNTRDFWGTTTYRYWNIAMGNSADEAIRPMLTITVASDLTDPVANAGDDQSHTTDWYSNPVTVTLDGSASVGTDSAIASYSWSENDTEIATGETPSVELAVGVHDITLTVTDGEGDTHSDTVKITILDGAPTAPVADAGGDRAVVDLGEDGAEDVTLDASASYATFAGATITGWSWSDSEDNILGTTETLTLTLTAGYHELTLTVTDSNGLTGSDTFGVNIGREQLMNLPSDRPSFPVPADIYWPAEVGAPHICLWYGDKFAAVSITIDDNNHPQQEWWMQMGDKYGFTPTWFIIVGGVEAESNPAFSGVWDDYVYLDSIGGDVQTHTMTHKSNDDTRPEADVRYEYGQSQALIEENIPGHEVITIGYPYGNGNIDLAREYFIAGRGTVGTPNKPGKINWMKTCSSSGHIEGDFIHPILYGYSGISWMNNTSYMRSWLCSHFHTVQDYDALEADLAYIASLDDLIWQGSFGEVAKFGQERDSAEITVTENTESKIAFEITDRMDDSIFDHPLTIKIRIPDSWNASAVATQNGNTVASEIKTSGDYDYILVDAVPDRGLVEITNNGNVNKPGDANGDDTVDLDDFIILKQNYGTTGASWGQGDFNADGTVDLDDFIILKQNYGS